MSVKWLTRDPGPPRSPREGLLREPGLAGGARPHDVAHLDWPLGLRPLRAGRMQPVNGVAFAGDRGHPAGRAEHELGRTWREARLDYPNYPGPDTNLTWALWSFDWMPSEAGRVELVVRATRRAGAGRRARSGEGISPDGASGYHRIEVEVVPA